MDLAKLTLQRLPGGSAATHLVNTYYALGTGQLVQV